MEKKDSRDSYPMYTVLSELWRIQDNIFTGAKGYGEGSERSPPPAVEGPIFFKVNFWDILVFF